MSHNEPQTFPAPNKDDLARVIWETSRADESTISASGANIIAAAILREFFTDHTCDTGWFDRTVCPEPCGTMHSYCTICGRRVDPCRHDEVADA